MSFLSINELYPLFKASSGVSTDTRTIERNSIFFCLKGANFNANRFASEAIKKGASAAIVDEAEYATEPNIYLVENVLRSLQELARHHRRHFSIPFVGITGSNGKTTTKELIHACLSTQFKTHATKGNFNNHIGVPLTLLSIPDDTEIAIIEMGANHPGEIGELCQIAEPDWGIITNIGKAHLEGFGGYQGVINTKKEMYDFAHAYGQGVFVHGDDSLLMELSQEMNRNTYGQSPTNDVQVAMAESEDFLALNYQGHKIQTQLLGAYNYSNAAAAICLATHFGVETTKIVQALEQYKPANQRSQLLQTEKNRIYLDAYNANPSSMMQAIQSFLKNNNPKKLLILGDMLELGDESQKEHQMIVDFLINQHQQRVILVGEEFQKTQQCADYHYFISTSEAHLFLKENPPEQNYILLKGSRGIGLEKLLELL